MLNNNKIDVKMTEENRHQMSFWQKRTGTKCQEDKMKVLFATTNPAKVKRYSEELKEKDIEVLTIKDIEINLKPEKT